MSMDSSKTPLSDMKKKISEPQPTTGMATTLTNQLAENGGYQNFVAIPRLAVNDVPVLMRTNSNKRILNQKPINHPTKTLRMKSLLWIKPTISKSDLTSSTVAQLLPTLVVNLAALSAGLSLAYSAILVPQLKPSMDRNAEYAEHMYRPFTVDDEQGSWIASIFGLGAIFGGFGAGILGARIGRRKTLLLLTAPDVLGWTLIAAAQNLPMMLVGRFLCGFAAAGYAPSIQVYIAEIAQPHQRGWLSAITIPTIGMGSLLAYTLGAVMSWQWVAVMAVMVPAVAVPGLAVLSDSPYWYLQQGEERKALQVMDRFRQSDANALAELLAISDSLRRPEDAEEMSYKDMFQQLMHRQYRRPFLLLNFLFLLMTFSGKYAISFYAVEIFHMASENIDEYLSAIIVGFIKLVGSCLYLPAIRHFSRRTLLCGSSLTMAIALVTLGLSVYSHTTNEDSMFKMIHHMGWLPLVCVVIYMLADPMGLGSIPFLYSAEFYPSEMRSLLSGVTVGLANLEMFIVVKTFPNMTHTMGNHGTFWLYGSVCFAAVIFTLFFIPETKNKSLHEIEGLFRHKENKHVTPYVTPAVTPMATPSSTKRGMAPYSNPSLQFTL